MVKDIIYRKLLWLISLYRDVSVLNSQSALRKHVVLDIHVLHGIYENYFPKWNTDLKWMNNMAYIAVLKFSAER